MGPTACTEPQCVCQCALYLTFYLLFIMYVGNIYMSNVSSSVWVRSGAEMLREHCPIIKYKCCYCALPLSWCAGLNGVPDESVWIQDKRIKNGMKKIY